MRRKKGHGAWKRSNDDKKTDAKKFCKLTDGGEGTNDVDIGDLDHGDDGDDDGLVVGQVRRSRRDGGGGGGGGDGDGRRWSLE